MAKQMFSYSCLQTQKLRKFPRLIFRPSLVFSELPIVDTLSPVYQINLETFLRTVDKF